MIVKTQKEVKVYSFMLESSCVQQEAVVVGEVKYNSVRRRGLCCHYHWTSTEHDMPLQKTGGSPDSSHLESQEIWCRRHK
jgi:hypothetical protein